MSKATTTRPRVRATTVRAATSTVASNNTEVETSTLETVTVLVPKGFTLSLDDGGKYVFEAGTGEAPKVYAEHWFAKNMGVEIYNGQRNTVQ